ncbi:MAG: phytoene desaturase [Anderseniella sp.]|nr:phytoene desaturase [Anderseniella sp.]
MTAKKIIVIGAGVGGLSAALDLARSGYDVTVVERAATPGGKMRQVQAGTASIDAGPTVFTMRWIFEQLFADAGEVLGHHLKLTKADVLARHAWRQGGELDLYADLDRSADAIRAFAGPQDAQGYLDFCARSEDIFNTLKHSFIAAQRPSPVGLVNRVGFGNLAAMWRTAPFSTMWQELGKHFEDPQLRQLFGRYATYVGSSPWLAPATLMLVAHVEQDGVWMVDGGMYAVATAIQTVAETNGASLRFNSHVREITCTDGKASGVILADGEYLAGDAVIFNGDVSALGTGLLGKDVIHAGPVTSPGDRSLSAVTWCVQATTSGFDLDYHNVFFAEDYAREFDAVFARRTVTEAPTVYICAQDRDGKARPVGRERLLLLVNAPADGDTTHFSAQQMADLKDRTYGLLKDCGLHITDTDNGVTTNPAGFNELFPASGGALYGRASHGMMASFERPGAASKVPGLYLAGGSVHPGPGVPMAAMSGRLAASRLLQDFAD